MMISGAAPLLLLISAITANGGDAPVTDCEACSVDATCVQSQDGKNETATCSCMAGFVGDGVSCYNRTACNGVCCAPGYRWSSEQGCVDIDECTSSVKACTSPLDCENTLGSFDCLKPEEEQLLEHNDSSSHRRSERSIDRNSKQHSVLLPCGDVICPAGQDCFTVNGRRQCRDPCIYNTPLNDAWRSIYVGRTPPQCDVHFNGQVWYRLLLGPNVVRMSETCIPKNKCGTHAPLWLPERHPVRQDGIVSSRVCGHWASDCCYFKSNRIHIKACPGNFFVYKLARSSQCSLAYCTDGRTVVCGKCKQGETCVSKDSVKWRCEKLELRGPQVVCGRSFMEVGLEKISLVDHDMDASSAHLANFRCTAHNESDGIVWFRMERKGGSCGTQLRTNDTHAIYSNTLFVYPINNGNVRFSIPETFPLSCEYPLDTDTSLAVAVRPQLSVEGAVLRAGQRPRAVMSLYRNANYTDPYSAGPVVLPLGSALYVGVSTEEAAPDRFAVILENCYATPTADSRGLERFSLIQSRCPSNRRLVKVEDSGPSLPGRFTTLVSLFSGDYDNIFLHCSLSMCDPKKPSCTQTCKSRVSRSIALEDPLTIGPIAWEKAARENI